MDHCTTKATAIGYPHLTCGDRCSLPTEFLAKLRPQDSDGDRPYGVYLCDTHLAQAQQSYPQGWFHTPGDRCPHGVKVGGVVGHFTTCPECEESNRRYMARLNTRHLQRRWGYADRTLD